MKLAINASSAKIGGASTYLHNALFPILRELAPVLRPPAVLWGRVSIEGQRGEEKWLEVRMERAACGGDLRRLLFDHLLLPRAVVRDCIDVLFSTANIGPLRVGCGRALLVRNAAPFSELYLRRMSHRRVRVRMRVMRWLIRQSLRSAHVVLFPSAAMRDAAMGTGPQDGTRVLVAPYGTRHDLFFPSENRVDRGDRELRILNVSYYSDQKNLGTFLGAAEILRRRAGGKFTFDCTAGFDVDWLARAPQFPRFRAERDRFLALRAARVARDLGWVRYEELPEVYRAADIFVFPSYLESFGHPLVEAMACGLPVVAADTRINREICGDAAEYFDVFSAGALAETLERLIQTPQWRRVYREKSTERARQFTWERHAGQVAAGLVRAWGMRGAA